MIREIPFGEAEVVLCSTGFLLESFQTVFIERASKVSLDGLVKGYLLKSGASVGIGSDKNVRIWINEHSYRQLSHAQPDLRCRFVLAIEYIDRASALFG